MPASDKRARKKQHRDEMLARRTAELRRRRFVRVATALVIITVILGLAFTSGGGDEKPAREPDSSPSEAAEGVACGGPEPAEPADPQQFRQAPELDLEEGVDYAAVIETSCGTIEVDLLEDEAPANVNNFVFLAREGFYDNTTWHRIERNFVIQGGDPDGQNGTPPDGPGYTIRDELPDRAEEYLYGTLAMANSGQPDSGGSQFFIIVHEPFDQPAGLQAAYSIFGEVEEDSYGTLDALSKLEVIGGSDPVESVKPREPAYVYSIRIIER